MVAQIVIVPHQDCDPLLNNWPVLEVIRMKFDLFLKLFLKVALFLNFLVEPLIFRLKNRIFCARWGDGSRFWLFDATLLLFISGLLCTYTGQFGFHFANVGVIRPVTRAQLAELRLEFLYPGLVGGRKYTLAG